MKAQLPVLVSEREFLEWPETTDKVELIDGLVVRSPAPTYGHQEALRRLLLALGKWAEGRPVTIGQLPCDVRVAPDRILQPDGFVILERTPFRTKGPITRIPELCIEVLSSDVTYDRVTKRLLYAAAGVQELWSVSLEGYVERWTGPGLTRSEAIADVVRTPLLPAFELDVVGLFAEG